MSLEDGDSAFDALQRQRRIGHGRASGEEARQTRSFFRHRNARPYFQGSKFDGLGIAAYGR